MIQCMSCGFKTRDDTAQQCGMCGAPRMGVMHLRPRENRPNGIDSGIAMTVLDARARSLLNASQLLRCHLALSVAFNECEVTQGLLDRCYEALRRHGITSSAQ